MNTYNERIQSNEVVVKLSKASLKVEKTANQTEVALGDTITYTVKITNEGDVTAYNVIFKDEISKQTTFIPGTFVVNGEVINIEELSTGTVIPNIHPGKSDFITYEVKVTSSNCSSILVNQAEVNFDYRLPDGTGGTEVVVDESATVEVGLQMSQFKQMNVEAYLTIPEEKPDMLAINNASGVVDICSYHVIETMQGVSVEGQQLTGYKLIIAGKVKLSMEYAGLGEEQGVHSAYYAIPFSTFIILPSNYQRGSHLTLTGVVEDIYYKVMDIRNFFVNSMILINANLIM